MIVDRDIFLTGGFGFIGTALLARLLPDNRVTVFDNGWRHSPRFEALAGHPNLTIIQGDVLDQMAVEKAIGEPHIVIHMAAVAGVSFYYRMPLRTMQVNLLGSYHVLEAAYKARTRLERFIDISTSEVFGPFAWRVQESGITQQGDVADKRWTYSISKLAAEKMALCYYWERDLPVVSLRPFNIYGPGQIGEGAIQIFARRALQNEPLKVTGDGLQVRSWCYIDDMISALEAAMEKEKVIGHAYNIGNPRATVTILGLAERIRELAGSTSPIEFVPHVGTDVEMRVPNITRAREDLGFVPRVRLDEGLRNTLNWYRETGAMGEDLQAADMRGEVLV